MKPIFKLITLTLFLVFSSQLNVFAQDVSGTWKGKFRDEHGRRWKIKLFLKNSGDNAHLGVARISRTYFFLHYPLFIFGEFPLPYSADFTVSANSSANGFGFNCKDLIKARGKKNLWCKVVSGSIRKKSDEKYRGTFSSCYSGFGAPVRPYGNGKLKISKISNEFPNQYEEFINKKIAPQLIIEEITYSNYANPEKNVIRRNSFGIINIRIDNQSGTQVDYKFRVSLETPGCEVSLVNGRRESMTPYPNYFTEKLHSTVASYDRAFIKAQPDVFDQFISIQTLTGLKLPDTLRFSVQLFSREGNKLIAQKYFAFPTVSDETELQIPVDTNRYQNPAHNYFSLQDRFLYFSGQISLATNETNYYDSRLLGTWVNDDGKWINVITRHKSGVLIVKTYMYHENIKKYGAASIRVIPNVANVDSLNFLEIDFGYDLEGKKIGQTSYIANQYNFINEDEMEIRYLSLFYMKQRLYGIDSSQPFLFKDNIEYRNFIKSNITSEKLFSKPIHYTRFKGTFDFIKSDENADAKALFGTALLLILGGAILNSDFQPSSINASYDKGKVIGYDAYFNEVHSTDIMRDQVIRYDTNYQPK